MSVRRPDWLIKKAPPAFVLTEMKTLLDGLSLHTVCESALCPNVGECFSHHTGYLLAHGRYLHSQLPFLCYQKGGTLFP